MKFNVASWGVTVNFGYPKGGWGHVKIVTIKSFKISWLGYYKSTF